LRYLRTPLDLPLGLFILSALVGVWASYDPATSWSKFALIVAAVAIYYGIVWLRAAPRLLEICVQFFLIGSAVLAVYFVTQNDFVSQSGKFDLITAIGAAITRVAPQLPFHRSHPNVVAGALEVALPINVALLWAERKRQKTESKTSVAAVCCSLCTVVLISFGLLMTTSRGAWLALGIVGAVVVLLAIARDALRRYALPLTLIVVLALFIGIVLLGDVFQPMLDNLLGAVSPGNNAVSRFTLFGQVWGVIQDYYFTGGGLGTFAMVFSTYALLIDPPFLTHAHNLFLEVWIEQGLLGFVALGWLVVEFFLWVWRSVGSGRSTKANWLMVGGIAAATVMLLHDSVDVLLYSSRALPLMFVPFALAQVKSDNLQSAIQKLAAPQERFAAGHRESSPEQGRGLKIGVALLIVAALGLVTVFSWNSIWALWYANLGSVAQARVELTGFNTASWRAGAARRTGDLSQAQADLQHALAFDSGNVTANQRLGAIAAARGEYTVAQRYLSAAQSRDPMNMVTWRLVANTYLAMGLKTDACRIAEQATARGADGAWMFPLPGCTVK
jgi:O-antigen ligase